MNFTGEGIIILINDSQFSKANDSIIVTDEEIVISSNDLNHN